jgi:hypothetical protein
MSRRVALAFAALKLVLQLGALTAYGYFRDELYYLACANHLALGYVDHPPFSIAVLAAWRAAFGDSLIAIRLVPALAGAALVYFTGRIVISLGGSVRAVALACLAVVCGPAFVATDHYYSMNALDHLFWAVAVSMVLERRWKTLGLVLGLGLLNKASVLWFGAGLAVFLLTTRDGRTNLRTPGPWLAAGIAMGIFAPHIAWQIANGFPTAEFARNAMEHKYVPLSLFAFLRESALMANPFAFPLALAGIILPLRARTSGRLCSIVFLGSLAIIASSKAGKAEYLNAAYPLVFAAGAVAIDQRLTTGVLAMQSALLVAFLLLVLPLALPVLGERSFIAYADRLGVKPQSSEKKELAELPQFYADMHGWTELVDETQRAWNMLTRDERANAKIWAVTGGYGPAAAIEIIGGKRGLPRPMATHNNYWLWGPGEDTDAPVLLVGGPRDRLEQLFDRVEPVATVECGYCMPYENHKPIYIGRGMKRRWGDLWPELKHYE